MDLSSPNRYLLRAATAAVLAAALFAAWVGLRIGGEHATLWVDDVGTPLAAGAAFLLCLRARGRHAGRMRLFWTLLACATASWTLAEIVWGYYALILSVPVPVPSWADVGYLGAIPFTIAAFLAHPSITGGATHRARWISDGLLVATALMFLSWTLVLGPVWSSADLSTWAGVVALAYPFGDVLIIFFVVRAIRGMTVAGPERLSMWCLLGALAVMALSNGAFSYLNTAGSYTRTSMLDTGWVIAYLGIALAALASVHGTRTVPSAGRERPSLASLVAPIVPVLGALTVAAVEMRLGKPIDRASWWMALALVVLVLARQGLMVRELLGPSRHDRGEMMRWITRTLTDPAAHR